MRIKTYIAAIVAGVIGFSVPNANWIEATLFPVASKESLHFYKNTDKEVCWYIQFEKIRPLAPRYFSWVITLPTGERRYIAPYRPDGKARSANTVSKVGKYARYYNCAKKPQGVGDTFTLRAYAEYETSHGLWTLPREIGPHKVDREIREEELPRKGDRGAA